MLRPICEPVELPLGISVVAERVTIRADAPEIGSFMHFHDVAELVLFRRVSGEFVAGGQRHRLGTGALTFVPSMHHHDYRLDRGAMEWVLVQADPFLVESLGRGLGLGRLQQPFCAWPEGEARDRMCILADWLVEAADRNDTQASERLLELLLIAAAQAPEAEAAEIIPQRRHAGRLLPALEALRAAPDKPLSQDAAAALCRLSPAYFSRRFRRIMGMTFTDYARVYRLHLGARRIATSDNPVSEIAYGLGFSSPSHFTVRFRERFGMTPRDYRNAARRRSRGESE